MPITVGISGGTGSGKTTVAQKIISSLGAANVVFIQQDSYYRSLGEMPVDLRQHVNFDHPDAVDMELMQQHLEALRAGQAIDVPVYDFVTHTRRPETVRVEPRPVVVVEGILIFSEPRIRSLLEIKIFVECDADIRFIRRLERDMRERGRSLESVVAQYLTTVRPMHLQYVLPSKRCADLIVPEGGFNEVAIDLITSKIRSSINNQRTEPRP
jgi:uridine kinase